MALLLYSAILKSQPKEIYHGFTNTQATQAKRRATNTDQERLQVTTIEIALAFMWVAIFFKNKAALLPLFILFFDIFLINIFDEDFSRFCVTALVYAEAAKLNIRIPDKLRYALLAFASLYWVFALDEMLYNHIDTYNGLLYSITPYLVLALNAYIAAVLLMDGGRKIVGIADMLRDSVINRIARL